MKKICLWGCTCIGLFSCGQGHDLGNSNKEIVVFQETSTMTFADLPFLQDIEIIPMETSDSTLMGDSPAMIETQEEYYVIDNAKILRFDSEGNYINTIGSMGRGPNEYLGITSAEISDDNVLIFCSRTQSEYTFSKNGRFIAKKTFPFLFRNISKAGNRYWAYLGYRNQYGEDRLIETNLEGEIQKKFLPSDANILVMEEQDPMFIHFEGSVLFRESLSNQILNLSPDSVSVAYEFDFGNYAIPQDFFHMSDPYVAMELLLNNDFANIKKWFENDAYVVAEITIQKTKEQTMIYSYAFKEKKEGKWYWVHYPVQADHSHYLAMALKYMTSDSELLFLVEPSKLKELSQDELALFRNPEVISTLEDDDNYVVLKCKLKH